MEASLIWDDLIKRIIVYSENWHLPYSCKDIDLGSSYNWRISNLINFCNISLDPLLTSGTLGSILDYPCYNDLFMNLGYSGKEKLNSIINFCKKYSVRHFPIGSFNIWFILDYKRIYRTLLDYDTDYVNKTKDYPDIVYIIDNNKPIVYEYRNSFIYLGSSNYSFIYPNLYYTDFIYSFIKKYGLSEDTILDKERIINFNFDKYKKLSKINNSFLSEPVNLSRFYYKYLY